jgi:antagonist of KipI
MSLYVEAAGPGVTIQDAGRFGYGRFGVPSSGPMDWVAFEAARVLTGNPAAAGCIEIGVGGLAVSAQQDLLVAVTGAGYVVEVQGRSRPMWMTLLLRKGWLLELKRAGVGCWAYLAVAGGVSVRQVLGSAATYVRGRLGGFAGRALQPGDTLPAALAAGVLAGAGREIAESVRPVYSASVVADVVVGPQAGHFSPEILTQFLETSYRVDASSDRMGYRLSGRPIGHLGSADIISDGMVPGCVQVPASGEPIVMMADGPTTGGYPKIAAVTTADLPLVAQCTPGLGEIRFRAVPVEAAQARLCQIRRDLPKGVVEAPAIQPGW